MNSKKQLEHKLKLINKSKLFMLQLSSLDNNEIINNEVFTWNVLEKPEEIKLANEFLRKLRRHYSEELQKIESDE